VLGFKLEQFKNGESVTAQNLSELDVSQYLYKICTIYGNDIEFQDSTRNMIDDMFESNQVFYSVQFAFYMICYILPMFL